MRIIPIHSAKRRSSRTKLSHAGAAAMMVLAVGLAALGSAASAVAQEAAKVDYPTGYRDWTHVKSMVIYESFGGIHHIYANQSALEGYRTGSFADGPVIIFDLLEATAADNAITEGKRKVLGVMQKDGKRFAGTGGWGFEGFAAARWSARPPIRTTPRNERSAHD
jgi:Cytochrome P460